MPATYAIVLTVLFYALVIAEFFVPSGGVLGIAAALAAICAVAVAMTHSLSLGLTILLVLLITTPVLFALIVRVWPKTSIGRQMLNRSADDSPSATEAAKTLDGVPLSELVGRIGRATTHCLPAGQVIIDGHRTNAVSTGQPIDSGASIMAVRVIAGKLQVRLALADELASVTNESSAGDSMNTTDAGETEDRSRTPGAPRIPKSSGDATGSSLDDIDLDQLPLQ